MYDVMDYHCGFRHSFFVGRAEIRCIELSCIFARSWHFSANRCRFPCLLFTGQGRAKLSHFLSTLCWSASDEETRMVMLCRDSTHYEPEVRRFSWKSGTESQGV